MHCPPGPPGRWFPSCRPTPLQAGSQAPTCLESAYALSRADQVGMPGSRPEASISSNTAWARSAGGQGGAGGSSRGARVECSVPVLCKRRRRQDGREGLWPPNIGPGIPTYGQAAGWCSQSAASWKGCAQPQLPMPYGLTCTLVAAVAPDEGAVDMLSGRHASVPHLLQQAKQCGSPVNHCQDHGGSPQQLESWSVLQCRQMQRL